MPDTYGAGGIESYTSVTAKALKDCGHTVHVVAQGKTRKTLVTDDGVILHQIVPPNVEFRGAWRLKRVLPIDEIMYAYKVSRFLKKIVPQEHIDIVDTAEFNFEGLFYSFLFKKQAPLVVHLHGPMLLFLYFEAWEKNMRHVISSKLEQVLIKRSGTIISNSKGLAALVRDHYNVDMKNVQIFHNPIDCSYFKDNGVLLGQTVNVLFVGRLDKIKGISSIIKVVPQIIEKYPQVTFTFIGKDNGEKEIGQSYANYLKGQVSCPDKLEFYDWMERKNLLMFYQKCSIFMMPSLFESFGIVALEAMSCAKPVIATTSGGPVEFIEHNHDGLLIEPDNPDSLFSALEKLIVNKPLREELGSNAQLKMRRQYTPEIKADELIQIYKHSLKHFVKK